jgi:hypothetical protein
MTKRRTIIADTPDDTIADVVDAINGLAKTVRLAAMTPDQREAHDQAEQERKRKAYEAIMAEEQQVVALPEFASLNSRQARYALARVWGGCSNAQAASFAGYRSDTLAGLAAIGAQLNRHPGIVAAMVALHRLIALRDADVTDPTETTTGPMIVAVEETDDLPGTEE